MHISGFTMVKFHDGATHRSKRACERCHSRKVRCDIGTGTGPCSICTAHEEPCMLRMRRRKTTTSSITEASSISPHQKRRSQTIAGVGDRDKEGHSLMNRPEGHHSAHAANNTGLLTESSSPISASISSSLLFNPGSAILQDIPVESDQREVREMATSPGILSRSSIFGNYPGVDNPSANIVESDSEYVKLKRSVLRLYRAFDIPAAPLRQSLCEAFFKRCWTWMPVVDFDVLHESPSKPPSILIQQAIFLSGSQMSKGTLDFKSREEFYQRTKALLDTGYEKDVLLTLATLCMIQWWNPAAPTNISTNTSRFWVTYGIGMAQQLGLHRESDRPVERQGLRRRIWWTLYARDCLISASHSRPRIINDADCNINPPSVKDFPQPTDLRAQIFVSYVEICRLLSRLCQMLTRKGLQPSEEKDSLGIELLNWVDKLPPALKLVDENGSSRPYNFQVTQLHVLFLSTITLLYSPRPMFSINPDNTAAVVASTLVFRIYEAFHFRDQICYLGPIFSWHLLVASVTRLSCLRVPSLREDAHGALETTNTFLRELGTKWPSALNNLKNLEILRRDSNSSLQNPTSHGVAINRDSLVALGPLLFKNFGPQTMSYFTEVKNQLQMIYDKPAFSNNPSEETTIQSQVNSESGPCNRHRDNLSLSSLNEAEIEGADVANLAGYSWDHLDDPFAQDFWTTHEMEQIYSTDRFSLPP